MNSPEVKNMETVRRIFVEKKKGLDVEAKGLFHDLKDNLGIDSLSGVRVLNRYDVQGMSEEEFEMAKTVIFSEPNQDVIYDEKAPVDESAEGQKYFSWEYLPGQYDQRADSAAQCVQILTQKAKPLIRASRLIILDGDLRETELNKIKDYCINPVEARETTLAKPVTLEMELVIPETVDNLTGFSNLSDDEIEELVSEMGFAMSVEDLKFCRNYFRDEEKRDPTITEIRVIDTYWSDHCRHTTFFTEIEDVSFEDKQGNDIIKDVFERYKSTRHDLYTKKNKKKDMCLMDIATIAMKDLRANGYLDDLDESEEINACSINVNVDVDGVNEEWLVMFKNETHNHPTEIEPFGGAATCLGGAIRDPLSGRSYVYQAMRVTGSGDPTVPVSETLPGKLPQRKITTGAASGYSSYGNQIGLATGQVAEVYDDGFLAKRMEIGAVIGAAPKANVVRERPIDGDCIILLGGRTGRDGCGGATGSSKEHTEESLETSGSEVQKGNPPTERKIQRFFRKPEVSTKIKRCNDFGAGGVCVAIGELADGLSINLDKVPKKYEGLDGTELAISESQERMAVVVAKEDVDKFIELAADENLEAVMVAQVNNSNRLVMTWNDNKIVDISRDFLNTNGVKQKADVKVVAPDLAESYFSKKKANTGSSIKAQWLDNLADLNVCSQKGLVERFDSTIGVNTVLMPFGGARQMTPAEGMAAKIPLLKGDTTTGTLMSYGYNAELAKWSPFHGAVYAVVQSVAKIVAMGGDYSRVRLTFQEYFEKLLNVPEKWGKPFSALLGGFYAQEMFKVPSIGGKDSMSGTFMDMNVPPTLVSFAVGIENVENVISPEFKKAGNKVFIFQSKRDANELPDFEVLKTQYDKIHQFICDKKIISAMSLTDGGIAAAISKMAFGNYIGFEFDKNFIGQGESTAELFAPDFGSIIFEVTQDDKAFDEFVCLGSTIDKPEIKIGDTVIGLEDMESDWTKRLEKVFPTKVEDAANNDKAPLEKVAYNEVQPHRYSGSIKIAKPKVFIPVFPGTNCEYDSAKAFEKAGAEVNTLVVKNLSPDDIKETIARMSELINNSQIIMLPGGFSGGDEPDGSGKFIATAFRNPRVKESVMDLLNNRDGLILGICNGFQALIKLGLVPYGEIREIDETSPTLTFNTIGRHVSTMVRTRIASNKSPWFSKVAVGDIHTIPVSHGEGRFIANPAVLESLEKNGQIATQYVDFQDNPTYDICYNPNGSYNAIEGITSPDGRVLGKMAHSERIGNNLYKNIPGGKDQKIFESGVAYFS